MQHGNRHTTRTDGPEHSKWERETSIVDSRLFARLVESCHSAKISPDKPKRQCEADCYLLSSPLRRREEVKSQSDIGRREWQF